MADVREAGQALRRLREERGWTQRDVERLSGGELFAQQVSRLETGALSKPPMEDLILLGRLYGLSPTEMAHLYGYDGEAAPAGETTQSVRRMSERPSPEQLEAMRRRLEEENEEEEAFSARLRELAELERQLSAPLRRKLTHWLELIVALVHDERRTST